MNRLILLGAVLSVIGCSKPPGEREYERGVNDLQRGNAVGAKVQLERSIDRRPAHPENAMAFNLLGMAAFQLGQFDEAAEAFENSRRINPLLVEPVYNLGVLAAERGDLRGAARWFNDAAMMDPNDTLAMEYLAHIYATRNQWMLARNALQTADERTPNEPRILAAMAEVERAMGQPEPALDLLVRALEKNTRYAPALFNLAVLHETDLSQPDQARAYYQRYLSLTKDTEFVPMARQGLARLEGQPVVASGLPPALETQPAANEAEPAPAPPGTSSEPEGSEQERILDAAEQLARGGRQPRAWALFRRAADTATEEGRLEDHGRILLRAGEACPDVPAAQTALGDLLLERNQITPALNAYRRALAREANFAPALVGEARVAIRQEDIDTALFILRQAVVADEGHPDAHWELARLYDQHTEQADNAARSYREFARIFASDPRAPHALARATELGAAAAPPPAPQPVPATTPPRQPAPGLAYRPPTTRNTLAATRAIDRARQYRNQQDWERAIFFYLNALENDDTIASIFANLGFCYGQIGELASARAAYLRAIEMQPASSDSKYNLALLYQRDGNLEQARRWMGDVLREQPDNAKAHYAMGTILATSPATATEARRHYQRFLELAPDDRAAPAVRNQLRMP